MSGFHDFSLKYRTFLKIQKEEKEPTDLIPFSLKINELFLNNYCDTTQLQRNAPKKSIFSMFPNIFYRESKSMEI